MTTTAKRYAESPTGRPRRLDIDHFLGGWTWVLWEGGGFVGEGRAESSEAATRAGDERAMARGWRAL